MSITITDPGLLALLRQADGPLDITDAEGNCLGRFTLEGRGRLPTGVNSPFTDQQSSELRTQRDGRKLADILHDLRERS